jgi:hypothetical protein
MSKAMAIRVMTSHFEDSLSKKKAQFYVNKAFTDNEADKYRSADEMADALAKEGVAQTLGASRISASFGLTREEAMSMFRVSKRKIKDPDFVPGGSRGPTSFSSAEELMTALTAREAFMEKNADKLKVAFKRSVAKKFPDMDESEVESAVVEFLTQNNLELGKAGVVRRLSTDDFLSLDIENIKDVLIKKARVMAEQKLTSESFVKKNQGKVLRATTQKIKREFNKDIKPQELDPAGNEDHRLRLAEVPNFDELSAVVLDIASKIDFGSRGIDPDMVGPMSTGNDVLSPVGPGARTEPNVAPEELGLSVASDAEYAIFVKDKSNQKIVYTLEQRPNIYNGYARDFEDVADNAGEEFDKEDSITAVRADVDGADVLVVDARASRATKQDVKAFMKKALRQPKTAKTPKLKKNTVVVFVKNKIGSAQMEPTTPDSLTESLLTGTELIGFHLGDILSI